MNENLERSKLMTLGCKDYLSAKNDSAICELLFGRLCKDGTIHDANFQSTKIN